MRKLLAKFLFASALATTAAACSHTPPTKTFVKVDQVALGKVVVYRNGVAFYERRATVTGGALTVSVPRDRVDKHRQRRVRRGVVAARPGEVRDLHGHMRCGRENRIEFAADDARINVGAR